MTANAFSVLPLSEEMLKTLESLDYKEMTPIQAEALPHVLNKKDVIAKAKTGSGKTAVFGIGLLSKLDIKQQPVQALVLCPTRELADQVSQEIRRLARLTPNVRVLTLCGGKAFKPQADSLSSCAHIVVGTPGRVLDHIKRKTLKLGKIHTFVLDEADRMLDLGFQDVLEEIIESTPKQKQTLLFSATYPEEIKSISRTLQKNPIEVSVSSTHQEGSINQLFYEVNKHERNNTLLDLLRHYKPESAIVFCNTKLKCKEVVALLKDAGFHALAIHSELEQKRRDQILIQFANKSCSILVATDVAARGLDIDKVEAVINYELSRTAETHMHRIGRTGRAGNVGLALSLFVTSETYKLNAIEDYQKAPAICDVSASLDADPDYYQQPLMRTLCISGGKKQKLRPGDILGALTGDVGIAGSKVGKIHIGDYYSYVGIEYGLAKTASKKLEQSKIKGKNFRVHILS